jgi:DNA mismatch repair ATPase MutS
VPLLNEAFASTNEREGSEIARQILRALTERGVRVFFVTHLFELSRSFEGAEGTLFLRAERDAQGRRTYRVVPARPLPTSHAQDVYERIFGPGGQLEVASVAEG